MLWAYVAAVAFTRVFFGAHFPLDILAGTALGTASAMLVAVAFERRRRRRARSRAREPLDDGAHAGRGDAVARGRSRARRSSTRAQHVGRLVIVDDGSSPEVAQQLDRIAADAGAELVRLPARSGKGTAVRAGIDHALANVAGAGVLVIDADGQHPASRSPPSWTPPATRSS